MRNRSAWGILLRAQRALSNEEDGVAGVDRIQEDLKQLLTDLKGLIDEALVQVDLGEMDARDIGRPLVDRIENTWLDLKARLEG